MRHSLYFLCFYFLSIAAFAQTDPAPNLDIETVYKSLEEWSFKQKPYRKVTVYVQGKLSYWDEFDSEGRNTERQVDFNQFMSVYTKKYSGGMIVETVHQKTNKPGVRLSGNSKNEKQVYRVNFDDKGKIIFGEQLQLRDSVLKVMGRVYFDKKKRIVRFTDTTGVANTNYHYIKNNMVRKERIYHSDTKNKTVTAYDYVYDNDRQPLSLVTSVSQFTNGKLVSKRISSTIEQTFREKLLVRKVLKDNATITDRNYTYDQAGNLTAFNERKIKYDGTLVYEKWRNNRYENNVLVYSDDYDGSSTHPDGKEGNNTFEYTNGLLTKLTRMFDVTRKRTIVTAYSYNELRHLIKKVSTFTDTGSETVTEYMIDYY